MDRQLNDIVDVLEEIRDALQKIAEEGIKVEEKQ